MQPPRRSWRISGVKTINKGKLAPLRSGMRSLSAARATKLTMTCCSVATESHRALNWLMRAFGRVGRIDRSFDRSPATCGELPSVETVSGHGVLERFATGDSSAAEGIVLEFGPLVWSLSLRFLGNRADAEDATQDIFIAIWEAAAKYRRSVASEKTFVAMIARRRLIDRRRRMSRSVTEGAADVTLVDVASAHSGDCSLEREEEVGRTVAALTQLRPEERGALQLSIREGWTHSQIAERLQIPVGTVKTHIRRGVQKVRDLLGEGGDVRSGASA